MAESRFSYIFVKGKADHKIKRKIHVLHNSRGNDTAVFLQKGINYCDFYRKKPESFCDFYPETLKSLYGRLGVSVLHIQISASMV